MAAAGLRATAAVGRLSERDVVAAVPREEEAAVGSFSLLLPTAWAEGRPRLEENCGAACGALAAERDSRARRASTSAVCDDRRGTAQDSDESVTARETAADSVSGWRGSGAQWALHVCCGD